MSVESLDVVIVNWNSGELLGKCLRSLRDCRSLEAVLRRLIVVDNCSRDGSLALAHDTGWLPVYTVRNDANLGFAAACNQGAACGAAGHILFLNPDMEVAPDCFERLLEAFTRQPWLATKVVGARLTDRSGRTLRCCSRIPTGASLVRMACGLDRLLPGLAPPHFMLEWDHAKDREVGQVMGAFFLVPRELFTQLGGFDERFFVYWEDVDFAKRARDLGGASWYLAGPSAHHVGGGSSRHVPARRLFYSTRGRLLYARKHHGRGVLLRVMLATLLIEPILRVSLEALRGSPKGVVATIHAYALLLNWLGRLEARRRLAP